MAAKKRIGELLVEQGAITPAQLEQALGLQQRGKRFLGQILLGMGVGDEFTIYRALSELLHVRLINLQKTRIDPQAIQLVPALLAVTRDILPLAIDDNSLYVVMDNPRDLDAIQIIEFTTERQVKPLMAPLSQLREMIRRAYHIALDNQVRPEQPQTLEQIGLSQAHLNLYRPVLQQPQGLIFVVGPPQSGKTTTAYASLAEMKQDLTRTLISLEKPIKTPLPGIKQIQILENAGLTFTSVLSMIHDQAPGGHNGIFVSDMSDPDTLQIALRITETGHLVLSRLYTPDALTTVTHLLNRGIAPELLAANLLGVIAQRMVQMICPFCKIPYRADEHEMRMLGLPDAQKAGFVAYKGIGCTHCQRTGYAGQAALYELFLPDAPIRQDIAKGVPRHALKKRASEGGMKTLLEDGIEKVRQGITTVQEVTRVCCVICPGCGHLVPETELVCPTCHYHLNDICKQCGAKVDRDWRVCPFCGMRKSL